MRRWRNGVLAALAVAVALVCAPPARAQSAAPSLNSPHVFRRLPPVEPVEGESDGEESPQSSPGGVVVVAPPIHGMEGSSNDSASTDRQLGTHSPDSFGEVLPVSESAIDAAAVDRSPALLGTTDDYLLWISGLGEAQPSWGDEPMPLPADFVPWWDAEVRRPLGREGDPLSVDIAALCEGALRHSSFVHVVTLEPEIIQSEVVAEASQFDWRVFLETKYNDVNEPIGNTLTTGTNADRYRNQVWSLESGLRRRNVLGGETQLFQRFGTQEDNSRFLVPNPQSTTRLELQYTQPILNGAGRLYNESRILLAQLRLDQSSGQVAQELEGHLVKVTEAYWELYRTRAEFYQRRKLFELAVGILSNLESRRAVDAVERQVFRARTAVANRRSELVRAETRIRNWQSQLRLLVNDPVLVHATGLELTPTDSPTLERMSVSMSDSLHEALVSRPDIAQAILRVRAAAVELGVAQQEILPKLDFVASSYVAGLAGESSTRRAFGDQFSRGRPTYSLGLQFEIPVGNHAAQARAARRAREMQRAISQFRLTVEEALTSVEIAVREVETSYREVAARIHAMRAAQAEANYLNDRWRILPGVNDSAAQLLENLLDAQERVAEEEGAMARAQIDYVLSVVQLKSELGTLLRMSTAAANPLEE